MTRHPANAQGFKSRMLARGPEPEIGWRMYCDQDGCSNASDIRPTQHHLPLEEFHAAGWLIAQRWGDACPLCAAKGLKPSEQWLPQRIQLSRAKGWRLPTGAVSIARPGRWGNPFRVGSTTERIAPGAIRVPGPHPPMTPQDAVESFRNWIYADTALIASIRLCLRGKTLACWCPTDAEWCHGDLLLDIAAGRLP